MLGQETFGDGAALQLSREPNPPLFTMGEQGRPVNIWQWKAAFELDLEGARDIATRYPNTPDDQYGAPDRESEPLYVTGRAAKNPLSVAARKSAGEALTAEGFGTLAVLPGGEAGLAAKGVWSDGTWDVAFVRSLHSCCAGELPLEPGATVFFAGAVWNGALQERDGQKSVTVWHELFLEE